MYELIPIIKDLAIIFSLASIIILICQKTSYSIILGYIITGFIIGIYSPYLLTVINTNKIGTLSELGIIFLMFVLGLDFNFHKLKRIGFAAIVTGSIKIIFVTLLGFYFGKFMQWSSYGSIFLGLSLAISSTTIIMKSLDELNLRGKRFAELILGILIIEDLLAAIMLTVLSMLVKTHNLFFFDVILLSIKVIVVIGSWFLLGYFMMPILFRRITKYISQENLTIVSVALCLSAAVIATYYHCSSALGAFIIGSILAEIPFVHQIKQLFYPLRDIFAAIFFISIGMIVNLKILIDNWQIILCISFITIIGKITITSLGTLLSGQSLNTSVRTGFSVVPIGEFSFVIMQLCTSSQTIDVLFQIIISVAAITTLVTPYLMKLSGRITESLDINLPERVKYLLESYSTWVYHVLTGNNDRQDYKKFIIRFGFNGIIVGIIFNLTSTFIFPYINYLIANAGFTKAFIWIITLIIITPFVWGMLFSFKIIQKSEHQLSLVFLSIIITITEIIILSIIHFGTWHISLSVFIITIVLFSLFHKQLEILYHWVEENLIRTSRKKHSRQSKYEELAPWDTHLVELIANSCSKQSILYHSLNESQLRQKFGINIVAIQRGSEILLTPRGEEKILMHDKLIVLGNDKQIETFTKYIEDQSETFKNINILENFMLKTILLNKKHPFVGKSIRDSKVREQYFGIVVGLERNNFRMLNPDSTIILKNNDLLLIVGLCNNKL